MTKRRVVVTGLGIISPVGNTITSAWQNILAGRSGIKMITSFDTSDFTTKFAGTITDFAAEKYFPAKEARKVDLFIQYGVGAASEAIADSGIATANIDKDRVGVFIGSGIGGIGTIENNHKVLQAQGPRRISPFFIPGSIVNMISGHVSIQHGFRGPNLAVATACTTGTHSIGLAYKSIAYNDVDVAIAGGAECASTPLGMGGFSAARALSTRNDSPETASRPWDRDRDGFVLGDGAGCLVLEELEHAKKRGATIYAEIVGFGMSGDAYHITSPSEGGVGAALSMQHALKDAAIAGEQIDYINAHGTSTQIGDITETQAIKLTFKEHAYKLMVNSTKSMTGHLLGAAGAVEAVFSVLTLQQQIAPPTINIFNQDPECDLDYVANVARPGKIEYALSNSFGFGGTNGSLVFKKY